MDRTKVQQLCEALDNVTAALETCLTHYGEYMPGADLVNRHHLCQEARILLALVAANSLETGEQQ